MVKSWTCKVCANKKKPCVFYDEENVIEEISKCPVDGGPAVWKQTTP